MRGSRQNTRSWTDDCDKVTLIVTFAHRIIATLASIPVFLLAASIYVVGSGGCSVQRSELISLEASAAGQAGATAVDPRLIVAGTGPVTTAVVSAIDERPIGGASLKGGTTGGGSYADALSKGQLHYVDSVEGIRELITNNTPAILLIAAGTYSFSTKATKVKVCDQACVPTTPLAQQTIIAASCTNGEATYEVDDTHENLRFGSNKTLIGLGKGAVFKNAMISLSDVTNIILRNLDIEEVGDHIIGLGYGINLWPGNHVWVDHCTFRNIGRSYFNIMSNLDDMTGQTLIETGYVTITRNYFDGKVDGVCGQRAPSVLGTRQVPALTLAYNWLNRSSRYNISLLGPNTWAHVFNNYWSDIDQQGMSVVCGGTALAQGNVFEATTAALYSGDNGAGTYAFCETGSYGKIYAPMDGGTDEDNLLDSTSTLSLNAQTTDGAGLTTPVRTSGHTFTIMTPTNGGDSTESYKVTLMADPATVAAAVKAEAGAGTLF